MSRFEITRSTSFESAHWLPMVGPGHKCGRMHGHSYVVRATLCGPLDAMGWVADFAVLDDALGRVRQRLDHRVLNEVPGLENPTSEVIAAWIWRELALPQTRRRRGLRVAALLLRLPGAGVMAYASRTGTRRNLRALRAAGWRLMVSARGVLRTEGFRYALDNGAWTAFQAGEPFDVDAFERAVDMLGESADWIVLPDIVAGGLASLDFTLAWLDRIPGHRLIAVQDGMTPAHVRPLLGPTVGIFVGGSTEWKEGTMRVWGALSREVGCHCHVGRVNTARRIAMCAEAGVDSFDGSSVSRYVVNLPRLDAARLQLGMVWPAGAPGAPLPRLRGAHDDAHDAREEDAMSARSNPQPCLVLAIDPGATSGWALLDASGAVLGHAAVRKAAEILAAIRDAMDQAEQRGVSLVVCGESWKGSGGRFGMSAQTMTGIGASWGRWAACLELAGHPARRVVRLDTGTWRKRAYGGTPRRKSDAWKRAARLYVERRLGVAPESDDVCEAIVLGHVAIRSPEVAKVLPKRRAS